MGFQMRWLYVVTATLVVAISTPAQAHWANTEWGSSEAAVRALYANAEAKSGSGEVWLEVYNQEFAGFTWDRIAFTFKGGQLAKVLLVAEHVTFDALRDRLAGQLGQPLSMMDRPGTLGQQATFRDPAKGNLLVVRGTRGVWMSVEYSPLSGAF